MARRQFFGHRGISAPGRFLYAVLPAQTVQYDPDFDFGNVLAGGGECPLKPAWRALCGSGLSFSSAVFSRNDETKCFP